MSGGWWLQVLVTRTTVVNGEIDPIQGIAEDKAVFYGIGIAGLSGCSVSSGSVQVDVMRGRGCVFVESDIL
jgi:hypothetical protein